MSNWESTGKIIKDTFAMAKKDKALYAPPILNLIVSMVLVVLAILVLLADKSPGGIGAPTAALALVMIFLAYLATAFFEAALSWMVFETVQGKRPNLGRGLGRAFKKTGSLFIYALVSFVVMLIANQLRKDERNQNLFVRIIKGFFASVLEKAWDIAAHLMLPAIVLTEKSFAGAAKELPSMIKNLPQVLVGGFAFDFVVGWIYLLDLVIAIIFGWMFMAADATLGIIVGVGVFFVLFTLTYVLYTFVKSVYFTMMYLDMHPELKKRHVKG